MTIPDTTELRSIYHAFADGISRSIFRHRMTYAVLGETSELTEIIYKYSPDSMLLQASKLCFYGAGGAANWLIDANKSIPFVIDKYKTGTIEGIPIISLETFLQLPDCREYFIIIAVGHEEINKSVEAELSSYGLRYASAYFELHPRYFDLQYFDLQQLNLQEQGEFFVDAGALDGTNTRNFFRHCKQGHSYIFEPNPEQLPVIRKKLEEYGDRIELFPFAVYDQNTALHFNNSDDKSLAKVTETGNVVVEARTLDEALKDRRVTFIKMDIEGSELAALRGAQKIIKEQRPRLAVCVYHKPEDIWEIPGLLLQYHPDYQLYLRHYSITRSETVLYAV
ncbi:MAG: FkbM family methyltransferase [Oscillospiraceae bacterium]|nr:FkbM family methyltransferase [Oscillospiraceae bacterium]